jgi:imidazolonepropionase-like amidohydrolase
MTTVALKLAAACGLLLLACHARPEVESSPRSAAGATARRDAVASVLAFVNVNVVPMDQDHVLPGQTVVVKKGRIVTLGPADSTPVPPAALRIEGQGRYLLPGLADMHAHVWENNDLLLYLAHGVTTVRNMWGTIYSLDWRKKIEKGLMLGPRLITTGPLLDGTKPRWPRAWGIRSPQEAVAAVHHHKRLGYDAIKVYDGLDRATFEALVAAARNVELPVVGHVPFAVGLRGALGSMASIEHLTGWPAALRSAGSPIEKVEDHLTRARAWQHVDLDRLASLAAEAKRAGTAFCPTLGAFSVEISPAALARHRRRPEMQLMAPFTRWDWQPKAISAQGRAYIGLLRQARAQVARVTKGLHDAGVPLLLGTDAGFFFVFPGLAVHQELRRLVAAGLTPYQALRTATVNPAAFLGRLDRSGTVAVGKDADLVLVAGDPLADVARAQRIVGVVRRGRWLPREAIIERLQDLSSGQRAIEAPGPRP